MTKIRYGILIFFSVTAKFSKFHIRKFQAMLEEDRRYWIAADLNGDGNLDREVRIA